MFTALNALAQACFISWIISAKRLSIGFFKAKKLKRFSITFLWEVFPVKKLSPFSRSESKPSWILLVPKKNVKSVSTLYGRQTQKFLFINNTFNSDLAVRLLISAQGSKHFWFHNPPYFSKVMCFASKGIKKPPKWLWEVHYGWSVDCGLWTKITFSFP